jgi:decaprenyl-phosphate phosphoribosyltransferase
VLSVVIEACRPRQWVKNLLVFAAPLVARTLNESTVVIDATVAFISFCAASSAMYLINDIQDRNADAVHPRKRLRPIASGRLSPQFAGLTATMLALVSVVLATLVSTGTLVVVCIYLLSTIVYSMYLKKIPILELLVLASGFVLRALAGAFAAHVPPSKWFLLCVLFGSLFIAIKKRYAEMSVAANGSSTRHVLAWYSAEVLHIVARLIGGLFVLAYLGWSIAADHQTVEQYVLRIFSALPFAIAIARYEYEASGENGESPEDLFASDRVLQLLGVAWFTLVSTSIYVTQ